MHLRKIDEVVHLKSEDFGLLFHKIASILYEICAKCTRIMWECDSIKG